MKINNQKIFPLILIAISISLGLHLYKFMPPLMASHWNFWGQVDGYMPKFWALFLMPFISSVLYFFFLFLPGIDPYKKNFEEFAHYYHMFINIVFSFLFYVYILTLVWNIGEPFNMGMALAPAFSILWMYAAILMQNTKQNWFVGIRTPWTLSNKKVWEETHMLGSKLFSYAGLIAFFGFIFPKYALLLILFPIIIFSVYLFVFSYLRYKIHNR